MTGSSPQLTSDLSRLFLEHADFVHRVLLRLGVPSAEVEDALQEVFIVVAHRLDSYEERGAMRAWLFVIARQVSLHVKRASLRRARQPLELVPPEAQADPHAQLLRTEAIALVRDCLAQMDERLSQVFYLAEVEELTVPEIAVALGINLNTAYSRLRLARRSFERQLNERERGQR